MGDSSVHILFLFFVMQNQVALIGSKIEWEHEGDGVDSGKSRQGSSSLTELECSIISSKV